MDDLSSPKRDVVYLLTNSWLLKELLANEITVFKDRVRIDVQISTPGLKFEKAWAQREVMIYQGQSFSVVSKSNLISSKKAGDHAADLEDVRLLW